MKLVLSRIPSFPVANMKPLPPSQASGQVGLEGKVPCVEPLALTSWSPGLVREISAMQAQSEMLEPDLAWSLSPHLSNCSGGPRDVLVPPSTPSSVKCLPA